MMTDEEFIKEMGSIFGTLRIVSETKESREEHKPYFNAYDNSSIFPKKAEPKIVKCKKEK